MVTIVIISVFIIAVIIFYLLSNRKRSDNPIVETVETEQEKSIEVEKKVTKEPEGISSPLYGINYEGIVYENNLLNPVENTTDTFLFEFCKKFRELPIVEKETIRKAIATKELYVLLTYIERCCVYALRSNESRFIEYGATAITLIESKRTDFRDALSGLAFLYHTIRRLNLNADEIFIKAMTEAESNTAELIDGFIKRNEKSKDLKKAWGYEEIETENGIGFIRYEFNTFIPTIDLKRLGLSVSAFLQKDKYYPGAITSASDLPLVWLKAEENKEIKKIVKAAKGSIKISSKPLTEPVNKMGKQMLLIFIGQMNTEEDATSLYELSAAKNSTGFAKVELSIKDVFCIVIASSTFHGVESIESNQSLIRFKKPLQEMIKEILPEE